MGQWQPPFALGLGSPRWRPTANSRGSGCLPELLPKAVGAGSANWHGPEPGILDWGGARSSLGAAAERSEYGTRRSSAESPALGTPAADFAVAFPQLTRCVAG